jgi:hypothetical protein
MRSPAIGSAIALCLAAAVAAEPRQPPQLLDAVALWLEANFDLPAATEPPALASATDAELVTMRYGNAAVVPLGDVVALYDDSSHTIYVAEGWTGGTPAELSVLVHEMVHHQQAAAGMRFACPGEREVLAYRAQGAWLGLFGETLESAFGIDAGTILVGTACTH